MYCSARHRTPLAPLFPLLLLATACGQPWDTHSQTDPTLTQTDGAAYAHYFLSLDDTPVFVATVAQPFRDSEPVLDLDLMVDDAAGAFSDQLNRAASVGVELTTQTRRAALTIRCNPSHQTIAFTSDLPTLDDTETDIDTADRAIRTRWDDFYDPPLSWTRKPAATATAWSDDVAKRHANDPDLDYGLVRQATAAVLPALAALRDYLVPRAANQALAADLPFVLADDTAARPSGDNAGPLRTYTTAALDCALAPTPTHQACRRALALCRPIYEQLQAQP